MKFCSRDLSKISQSGHTALDALCSHFAIFIYSKQIFERLTSMPQDFLLRSRGQIDGSQVTFSANKIGT